MQRLFDAEADYCLIMILHSLEGLQKFDSKQEKSMIWGCPFCLLLLFPAKSSLRNNMAIGLK